MREIRLSGSEGGGTGQPVLPTPIALLSLRRKAQSEILRFAQNDNVPNNCTEGLLSAH